MNTQYTAEELYFSIESLMPYKCAFNFVIGGRGTGKTYGALKYMLEHKERFIFMRRSQTQLEQVMNTKTFKMESGETKTVSLNPFKAIERDTGMHVEINRVSKDLYAIFYEEELAGYGVAMNTISNIRGFDASDVDFLIYDEFIPEPGTMQKENEGDLFLNAYESINRNRELNGRPPLYAYLLANANDIDANIMMGLGMTDVAEKAINKGKKKVVNKAEQYTLSLLENKKFEEEKKKTAIYKFTRKLAYNKMAFQNKFAYDDFTNICSKDIKEYKPLWNIGDYYIYGHKSRDEYYISLCKMHTKESYAESEYGIDQFKSAHGRFMYGAYIEGRILFETYRCKKLLTDIVA